MSRTRILIVEDEPIVSRDIQHTIVSFGYEVAATASSGEEAVKKAAEWTPDLVLMDIVLKGDMDGAEAAADVLGMTRGLVSGARVALRSLRTEMPQYGAQKDAGLTFAIKGQAGRIIRLPQRMLMAADDFWKTLGAEGAIHAQAYREAGKDGYAGTARVGRMADLITSDRSRLLDHAKEEIAYRTFQKDSPVAAAIIHSRDQIPGGRYVLPFVQTPINVMSFGVDHTPLAIGTLAARALRGTLKPGDLTEGAAKMAVGTGLAGAVVALAALLPARPGADSSAPPS
jgi:CheY-like chemotaxis protein